MEVTKVLVQKSNARTKSGSPDHNCLKVSHFHCNSFLLLGSVTQPMQVRLAECSKERHILHIPTDPNKTRT